MKNLHSLSILLFVSLLLSPPGYSDTRAKVGDKRKPPLPMKHVTKGYETDSIQLSRGLDGKIVSIETRACNTCELNKYTITPKTKAYVGQHQVTLNDLTKYNGKAGSISFYPSTKELHHFRFFNLEAAQ